MVRDAPNSIHLFLIKRIGKYHNKSTCLFVNYGCCIYLINATGGGYDWQYTGESIFVFACDEREGDDCKGRKCVQ